MSKIKEPYEISVWEEELIPTYSEYHEKADFTGDYLTEEEFQDKKYIENWVQSQENSNKYYYIYGDDSDAIDISQGGSLPTEHNANYSYEKVVIEHYEETVGIIIGAHDMDSVYAATNPILKENVNGSVELTFQMYYQVFDPDLGDFSINPFSSLLANERKIKLKYRNKWYDLIIKNRSEDSSNYTFNYTCKDLYVNELTKNGFKVELDTELENNQGTVTELSEIILDETDWQVAPTEPQNKNEKIPGQVYSDLMVETKVEPLYYGELNQRIKISRVHSYVPDDNLDTSDQPPTAYLDTGSTVLFFYSDLAEKKKNPQIICRFEKNETFDLYYEPIVADPNNNNEDKLSEKYLMDANEDIITNACNYQIDTEVNYSDEEGDTTNAPNIVDNLIVFENGRAEKVVKPQLSGYDPDLDKFIFKYYKLDDGEPDESTIYYGYIKTDILTSNLAQNYLANSDNFLNFDGWVFEGVPGKTTKSRGEVRYAGYTGQIYNLNENNFSSELDRTTPTDSLMVLQLRSEENTLWAPDQQGEYYLYKKGETEDQNRYELVSSEFGESFEDNLRAGVYDLRRRGADGYLDKTDEELEDIINTQLLTKRYSKRSRHAINTGVAANRQQIGQLTPGEEYMFAVSLGKYKVPKEGEPDIPEYGRPVEYGLNVPTEAYRFENIDSVDSFVEIAGVEAYDKTVTALSENKYKYYLDNPEYYNIYKNTYDEYIKNQEKEYERKYLNVFNNPTKNAKENWRSGGKKYRDEIVLEYLREEKNKTFPYYFYNEDVYSNCLDDDDKIIPNKKDQFQPTVIQVNLCKFIANKIVGTGGFYKTSNLDLAQAFYDLLIDGSFIAVHKTDSSITQRYYQGLYPSFIMATIQDAIAKQNEPWTIDSNWEPMGYDEGQYPAFDETQKQLVTAAFSINETLFSAFYYALRDTFCYVNADKILVLKSEYENCTVDKISDIVSSILKQTYKDVYKTGTYYKAYNKAEEYAMPGTFNSSGGEIYQQYLRKWQTEGDAKGKEEVRKKEEDGNLFAISGFVFEEIEKPDGTKTKRPTADTIDKMKELGNFILEKEKVFKSKWSFDQIGGAEYNKQYKEQLIDWVKEYFNKDPNNTVKNYYFYYEFLLFFMELWQESKRIGGYTYDDRIFDLIEDFPKDDTYKTVTKVLANGDVYVEYYAFNEETGEHNSVASFQTITKKVWRQQEDGTWRNEDVTTASTKNVWIAAETPYNPYTNKNQEEVGGYVFDRNTKQIRLFDLEKDVLNALYEPKKDDDGDYVFDPHQGVYRPYRPWRTTELRDPLTYELNTDTAVYGDIIHHEMKWFDGHIGDWEELPTRFRMVRIRTNPLNTNEYHYLDEPLTITETGHIDGEDVKYTITYPAGYQMDRYYEDDDGKYVLVSPAQYIDDDEDKDVQVTESGFIAQNKTYLSLFESGFNFFSSLRKLFGRSSSTTNLALKTSNIGNDKGIYDEDAIGRKTYNVDANGFCLSSYTIDELENAEIIAQNKEDYQPYSAQQTYAVNEPRNRAAVAAVYTKYKWWYWRHWGKQRYSFKQKICVYRNVNGVRVFKPFNKVEDVISKDYMVMTVPEFADYNRAIEIYNETALEKKPFLQLAFYLEEPVETYRQAVDADYGTVKYKMVLQDEKKKVYWVESPNGEHFLRHYKTGDGEIKLWDGHFGKWIECFKEQEESADAQFDSNSYKDYGNGLYEYTDVNGNKQYCLQEFYLPYNDIMVPYDVRTFSRKDLFTRIREKELNDSTYVLQDGSYIPYSLYKSQYGFTGNLNYTNLRVSFIDNYSYDNATFSISDITENRGKYLQFNLDNAPDGYMDLTVTKGTLIDDEIKERWAYWKAPVQKGFSLTKDPLQKIGILFETTDSTQSVKNYPFLGMQLFKHISYEKTIEETIRVPLEDDEKNKIIADSIVVDLDLEKIPLDETGIADDNKNPTLQEIQESVSEQIQNELKDGGVNGLIKKIYNNLFSFWAKLTDNTPQTRSANITNANNETLINRVDDIGTIAKTMKNIEYKDFLVSDYLAKYGLKLTVVETPEATEEVQFKVSTIQKKEITPLFPGQVPDADDLKRVNYYIYDPELVTDTSNVVYEYVGTDITNLFTPALDENCQKVRSIKGKESNYFKLLQDCCDTFDCWIEPIIEHEENGKVRYVEKPIYIQDEVKDDEEPQIYVGEDTKNKKVDQRIIRLQKRFGYNPNAELSADPNDPDADPNNKYLRIGERITFNTITNKYYWSAQEEIEAEQQNDLDELNYLHVMNQNLRVEFIKVPKKIIRFRRYVGEENANGFKYSVNLKHIKRTIDSNQISTRIIVKQNKNEYAQDGFCSIARASENTIKENFLLDFSYYIQQGLLKNSDFIGDLYSGINGKLNYYNKLARLNKNNDDISIEYAQLKIELDKIKASYDEAVLEYDSVQEEISKIAYTLTTSYDQQGEIIDTPWTYGKSQEYATRVQTSSPATTIEGNVTVGTETFNVVFDIPATATQVEYPKYNEQLRSLLDQMDYFQKRSINLKKAIDEIKPEKDRIEKRIYELLTISNTIANKKNELNHLFYHKYSRFIQEGSWIDENYMDDNLYYLDAIAVANTSSKPKITYDIDVADISAAVEFEEDRQVLENKLGDRTYVEDIEFFGYQNDGITPYWEEVVVSEKIYYLEDPSQNKIKIKNYTTQFDDLFQRIAATSQTLQFNEGSFNRAAALVQADGIFNTNLLQQTIASADFVLSVSMNEDVTWDNTGITVTNTKENAHVIKIVSRGILVSNDGGNEFKTVITGDGINADLLMAGRINTDMLLIGNSNSPNFFWDKHGISAFKVDQDDKIDYSNFIRLDQYGIYGIKDYDQTNTGIFSYNNLFIPRSLKEIQDNPAALFGLTWDGFFLRSSNGTGRVTIGTNQDLRMQEYIENYGQWRDKIIIGKVLNKAGDEYYGFRIQNNNNEIVMETNETGELYLKKKLRISNFNDAVYVQNRYKVLNGEEITSEEGNKYTNYQYRYETRDKNKVYKVYYTLDDDGANAEYIKEEEVNDIDYKLFTQTAQDRVTLGIVDVYKRSYNDQDERLSYTKTEVTGEYDSTQYLTKVFSVKENRGSTFGAFQDYHINSLIEENENFAVFDNGNIYAKNAWIEGRINADSGTLNNLTVIGDITVGSQDNSQGKIHSSNNLWSISHDGTANFRKISTAVFEKGKVQTLAGAMLVREGLSVVDTYRTTNWQYIVVDGENTNLKEDYMDAIVISGATFNKNGNDLFVQYHIFNVLEISQLSGNTSELKDFKNKNIGKQVLQIEQLSSGSTVEINKDTILTNIGKLIDEERKVTIKKCSKEDYYDFFYYITLEEFDRNELEEAFEFYDNDGCNYWLDSIIDDTYTLEEKKQALLYVGFSEEFVQTISNEPFLIVTDETYSSNLNIGNELSYTIFIENRLTGIGLNASSNWLGGLPPESISLVDLTNFGEEVYGTNVKLLLGKLSTELISGSFLSTALDGTYGLYCDNVLLQGSIFSQNDDNVITGLTTKQNLIPVSYLDGQSTINTYAVFFSGEPEGTSLSQDKLNFFVTQDGYLYANKGYFSGEIEASIIKTSKIIGDEDEQDFSLIIDGFYSGKGLVFRDDSEEKIKDYFVLANTHTTFFGIQSSPTSRQTEQDATSSLLFSSILMSVLPSKDFQSGGVGYFSTGQIEMSGNFSDDYNPSGKLDNFLFSIREADIETQQGIEKGVGFYYKTNLVASISSDGFSMTNNANLNISSEDVMLGNQKIGINFIL